MKRYHTCPILTGGDHMIRVHSWGICNHRIAGQQLRGTGRGSLAKYIAHCCNLAKSESREVAKDLRVTRSLGRQHKE